MANKVYIMENLGCAHCAGKIEAEVRKLPQVQEAVMVFETKQLRVKTEQPEGLEQTIETIAQSYEPDITVHDRDGGKSGGHHHHDHEHEHEHHHHHDHDADCCCGHEHEHEHHHHHDHDADEVFTSWGVETAKKFEKETVEKALHGLDSGKYGMILRAKGILPAADGSWIHFDYVPEEYNVRTGSADITGKLCVIGSKLDEGKLKTLFSL